MAELYGPVVFHWCRRARLQPADADDVIQEVFRTVAQRIDTFQSDSEQHTFRGWLWTIARHKIGDFLRKQKPGSQGIGGTDAQILLEGAAANDVAVEDSISEEIGGLYQRAMELIQVEFQPASWQAFHQVVIKGRSPADVAADLNLSTNAVYIAKSRVLTRLREELGDR